MPVFDDFHKIQLLLQIHCSDPEVVDYEQIRFSQLFKESDGYTFQPCDFKFGHQFLHAVVYYAKPLPACLMPERRGNEAFPAAGGPGDKY